MVISREGSSSYQSLVAYFAQIWALGAKIFTPKWQNLKE